MAAWNISTKTSGLILAGLLSTVLCTAPFAAEEAGKVFFIEPKDGATVTSPVKFRFGAEHFEVKPATDTTPGTGHFHLLINMDPLKPGTPIPFTDATKHFGKGQKEAEVPLAPGKYKITLQPGDFAHRALPLSNTINITVK